MTGWADSATYGKIKATANHIVAAGPDTTERWEEQYGKSPSSIAAEIAGLVAAGAIARANSDTASALGWDPAALLRVFRTPTLPPKLFAPVSTADGSLCSGPRRLAAIFVLGERRPEPATIDLLPPAAALRALLRNTYGERAVDGRVRARLLPFWTRLAREVPVHAVAPAEGLATAPSLIGALSAATGEDERPRPLRRGPVAQSTTPPS